MKCFWCCAFLISALLSAGALMAGVGLWYAADWLSESDQPKKTDAIIVLAGDPARAIFAADLYLQGYSKSVYVSRPKRLPSLKMLDEIGVPFPRYEDVYQQILLKKGVPPNAIHFFGKGSISTVDEALAVKNALPAGTVRVLIVTSSYHVRRTQYIFRELLPEMEANVVAMPYDKLPSRWWESQDAARDVLLESVKLLYYKMTGGFRSVNGSVESARAA